MIRRVSSALLLVFLTLSLWGSGQTQGLSTLQQAIASGEVNARFYGTGSSSGESVMVDVSRGPKGARASKTVTVPPGSRLASADAGAQGMTILAVAGRATGANSYAPSTNIVVPATGVATYMLTAFCAEFHKDNPSSSTQFTLRPPDETMACIGKQSQRAAAEVEATQAAVWMYTDHATFGEVNETFSVSTQDWDTAKKIASACGVTPR